MIIICVVAILYSRLVWLGWIRLIRGSANPLGNFVVINLILEWQE